MKLSEVRQGRNYTSVQNRIASDTSASLDIATSGHCSRHEEEDAANGQTASACYAEPSADGYAGFGIRRTTYGLRFILITNNDGYTLMPARRLGTNLACIRKDGVSRLLTASLFRTTVALQTLLDDTCGIRESTAYLGLDVPRKSCCI